MRNGCCERDVAHALTADNGTCNLNATFLTDDAFVANALVFTAVTFEIALRTENALVKKTVLFAALRTVVDGLRLGDLSV